MSGESRSELLLWLNSLLDLSYTKVEQCGSGAAYCQIFDSVFQDVPMTKVKFNAANEYQYQSNYKVLQSAFLKHRVEKTILVDKLVKCRFQDNLEFLQWMKKFWMDNKDESEYDPNARRNYTPPAAGTRSSAIAAKPASKVGGSSARGLVSRSTPTVPPSLRTASSLQQYQQKQEEVQELTGHLQDSQLNLTNMQEEAEEYRVAAEGLETERNFYFNKLREIEILIQNATEELSEDEKSPPVSVDTLLTNIQEILYSTEEGFQIPNEGEGDDVMDQEDDLETF
ncbi:hypothetical protein BABINDRAFT_36011 [Babjeviella inositovora NRRL Y-12698]|uniref:Calponin-homology (CH) domain-containing protein n=1 Tax=Babjeviella inositovora NRRL Y-12698 TaxID=984486 RepID=A0A1E3QPQ3_9ASCO|nr:uncharacterized protein BABINDRAFT_36011 [Babjeviella inositovora NRRL Y-12698]ODQ79689.1 hypothetical protein BABINDRAFT_36011 [Babjeviella inositovora NRRL Y-12698]